ncbi:MAG: hypothetical protein ACFFBH_12025 [Promethearchaeota archaeon]
MFTQKGYVSYMNLENNVQDKAIIIDLENREIVKGLYEAFLQAEILSLIDKTHEIYVHVPIGASFFRDEQPIEGTYLDVEFAEAIILASAGKPITFYETPATNNRNIKSLFEKFGYMQLAEKYSQVRILCLKEDLLKHEDIVSFNYGFDYPPVRLPSFLFNNKNLIISFSNPKAPFSENVAGFKGLPFSLSGKSLIIGSTLFPKKNLLHLAFSDIGLGLKDYIVDALEKIHKAGVACIGINGGHYAGYMIEQVKVEPIYWNALTVSTSIGISDAVTAILMGYQPQNLDFFANLAQKGLIPSNMSTIPIIEIGNSRKRLEKQLKLNNPFLLRGSPITTRKWILGLLKQVSLKDRLKIIGKIIPSIIKYKFKRKNRSNK